MEDRKTPHKTSSQIENEIDSGRKIYYPRPVSKSGNGCHSNLHDSVDPWGNLNWLQWLT
jgi:hypothetical protein